MNSSIYQYGRHLLADVVERVGGVAVLQLHVHGVAEQSQASAWPQHPVSLQQELLPVEPVRRRHGRQEVDLAGVHGQLLCWGLPEKGNQNYDLTGKILKT